MKLFEASTTEEALPILNPEEIYIYIIKLKTKYLKFKLLMKLFEISTLEVTLRKC